MMMNRFRVTSLMTSPVDRLRFLMALLGLVGVVTAVIRPTDSWTGEAITVAAITVAVVSVVVAVIPRHPALIVASGSALCALLVGRALEAAAVEDFASVAWLVAAGGAYVTIQGMVIPLSAMIGVRK